MIKLPKALRLYLCGYVGYLTHDIGARILTSLMHWSDFMASAPARCEARPQQCLYKHFPTGMQHTNKRMRSRRFIKLLLSMAPNHFHFRVVFWLGLFLRLRQALSRKCMVLPTIKCSLLVFDTSSKISTAIWNSYPLVEETRPGKWHYRRVVFSRPYV